VVSQVEALQELESGHRVLPLGEVVALASGVHRRYRAAGIRLRGVRPDWAAHARGILTLRLPGVDARFDRQEQVIVHPCRDDLRDEGFDLLHELAEAIVPATVEHPDVQTLAVALAVERRAAERALEAYGFSRGAEVLAGRQRWVPHWMVAAAMRLYSGA
jgi:hypothetical protein